MSEIIDHDTWNYGLPKSKAAPKIQLDPIYGVLPYDGVRNPSGRSAISQKIFLPYKTRANNWSPKVGIAESAAEAAVALEALISPTTDDLHFQPLTVHYLDENRKRVAYTHDLMITGLTGHRRLVFVRNENSLSKPATTRAIEGIVKATPRGAANDMVVVNAADYPRARRDNLYRLHHFVFSPDAEADEIVWQIARHNKSFYHMRDLFPMAPIARPRVFAACYRLVAQQRFYANLDHVLWEYSRLDVCA